MSDALTPMAIVLAVSAALAAPFAALAWLLEVYPRPPLVYLALVPALVSTTVLAAWSGFWLTSALTALLLIDGAVVLLVSGDLLTLPARQAFAARRAAGRPAPSAASARS